MAVVESAVSFLVSRLGDLLAQQVSLLSGVRGQVEWVETELQRMESFLIDADRSSSSIEESERMKTWRRELRDLVNSAEDAIDMFILRVEPLGRGGGCLDMLMGFFFIWKEVVARHQLASEIADIRLKLSSISDSRTIYGIEFIGQGADATGSVGRRMFQEHRLSSPTIPAEADFVGFEEELQKFISQLLNPEPERRCIFSVVGMGGLGKTTFANQVYNDNRVMAHFTERGWASVSQQYAVTDIYTALLGCFIEHQNDSGDMGQIIFRHLRRERYLIVLDDVWTNEAWHALKYAFPDSGNGSRILLTTRSQEVASHADLQIKPHELRVLNRDESWELFCKKTFPEHKNYCLPDFEEVGRQIVGKCHGLPLAIVAVGGMLAGKSKTEWEHVLKSKSWLFGRRGAAASISGILKLSYKDLPYDLKPCFLYLGIFPDDKEFRAKELIHMWAAEGLLPQRDNETVEEVGEDCVRALVQRRMIQVAEKSSTGGIKSCRIHDFLRYIAISEAEGDNFLRVQGRSSNTALSSSTEARRLAIHFNSDSVDECISSDSAVSHLRSLFVYSDGRGFLVRKQKKCLRSRYALLLGGRYKLLRVLYLHTDRISELPSGIGDLVHLRYFGCVGDNSLCSLPPSIGNLTSLQTLRIDSVFPIEIPCTIQKMQELRHLQVTYLLFSDSGHCSEFVGQPQLEQISNLRTLKHVKAGEWVDNSLGKLKSSLRKLGITLDSDAYYESIAKLESLQSLSLASPLFIEEGSPKISNLVRLMPLLQLRKLSLWGKLENLPEWDDFPPNLIKLTLSFSRLDQDAVATLEKLQNLRILRLLDNSYMGREMKCSAEGFPSLEYLRLESLPNLDKWTIEEGAMQGLTHLRLDRLPHLETWKIGKGAMRELTHLRLESLPNLDKWIIAEGAMLGLAHLSITDCETLKMLPEGMEHFPEGMEHLRELKKLEVGRMPEEFRARLPPDVGADCHLIRHIPSIDIRCEDASAPSSIPESSRLRSKE